MTQRSWAGNAVRTVGGSVLGSALTAALLLLLPKFLSKEDFGYFQLYLFFATYLGYASFGLADGLFLRLSGRKPDALSSRSATAHLTFLVGVAAPFMAAVAVGFTPMLGGTAAAAAQALALACASSVAFLARSMITFLFQAVGDSAPYANSTVIERTLHFATCMALATLGINDFRYFAIADLIAKIIGLAYALILLQRRVGLTKFSLEPALRDVRLSLSRGIFVCLAAIATVLVTAVPRLAAERGLGVLEFSELSLAFSLQNIVMTLLTPLGLVMLPSIRQKPAESLPAFYSLCWDRFSPMLWISLIAYVPLTGFARLWLPDYDLLPTLIGALLPVLIFESRTRVISTPFLQALGRERELFAVNTVAVGLSTLLSAITVSLFHSPTALAFSITAVVAARAVWLESLTEWELDRLNVTEKMVAVLATVAFCALSQADSWSVACSGTILVVLLFAIHYRNQLKAIKGTMARKP